MTDAVITLYELSKRHGERVLFELDELPIARNACTVLSGPNGAGKSTLLRVIAGLEAPDRGELAYKGERLPWNEARRFYAGEVIYLHQDPYLFDASVTANIAYGLRRRGLPSAVVHERVEAALRAAELEHLAKRPARHLSGGERQRVALVRAWVLAPALLLLDEPMANLDQNSRLQTRALLERLRADAVSMVVVSHDGHHLTGIADQYLHLEDGELMRSGAAPATTEDPAVAVLDRFRRHRSASAYRTLESS